jgi:D-alanine-D-alanine ligase
MNEDKKHVALLCGGWSVEREVSLVSGRDCAKGLREKGYEVTEVDVGHDVAERLADLKPDVVFNALHGQWGEDGCVQGLLEVLEIPYTHSGVLASAVAMDKERAKSLFASVGIHCAEGLVAPRDEALKSHLMEPPYVIKPVNQGSSVGVFLIREGDNRPPTEIGSPNSGLGEEVMLERFIAGRELTVAVMDGTALGVTEIDPRASFYDYESKYAEGGSAHILPAELPQEIFVKACVWSEHAFNVLGCRGVARADFRYDDTQSEEGDPGELVMLEINTQPGMTPTSLVPEQAAYKGISFPDLVGWMVEDASCQR